MFVFKDINKPAVIEQNVVNYTQNLSTSSAGITTTKIISGSSNTKYWDSLNVLFYTLNFQKVGGKKLKERKRMMKREPRFTTILRLNF